MPRRICPENQYGIEVGRELGQVHPDAFVAMSLGLIGDDDVDPIMNEEKGGAPLESLYAQIGAVNDMALKKIDELDRKQRYAIRVVAAMSLSQDVKKMAERGASLLFKGWVRSMVDRGEISIEDIERGQEEFHCTYSDDILRSLGSDKSLRLRLTEDQESEGFPETEKPSFPQVLKEEDLYHPAIFNQAFTHPDLHKIQEGFQRIDEEIQEQEHAKSIDLRTLFETMTSLEKGSGKESDHEIRNQTEAKPIAKARQSIGRKILRRSMQVFKQLVGQQELKAFLSDDGLEVQGHYFNYRIRQNKDVDLVNNAYAPGGVHIPYDLTMIDKKTGLEMADLCVLFENTPALDQVAALLMHIQTGEEKTILSKANPFNVRSEFGEMVSQMTHGKNPGNESGVLQDMLNRRHPVHDLANNHIPCLTSALESHFYERLNVSPLTRSLIEIGQESSDMQYLKEISERESKVCLSDICKEKTGIEWVSPISDKNHLSGPSM